MKLLGIQRAARFSPNSEARDAAIFEAVAQRLATDGHEVSTLKEEDLRCVGTVPEVDGLFSMSRSLDALNIEMELEKQNTLIWNSATARLAWNRKRMNTLCKKMALNHPEHVAGKTLPAEPPLPYPFWLKRDDETAQHSGDVRLVRYAKEWQEACTDFHSRGVRSWVCEAHLKGDLIKFYGVAGTDFFHFHYPTANKAGFSKFGAENCNGRPQGFSFNPASLKSQADKLATAAGLCIYGGDAIVTADGRSALIDFNDWPSFGACRDEAAQAIVQRIEADLQQKHHKTQII